MKKTFKIIGIIFLIVVALLIAIPFVFQSQIKDLVKRFINENVNAKVEFSDVNLSFLSSFPQAHVSIDDLVITNFEPFKDEIFATAKSLSFDMSIKELFKKADEDPIIVNAIHLNEALLTLKTNSFGDVNYNIAKESEDGNSSTEHSNGFKFDIKDYGIHNSAFTYLDESSNTTIYITDLNHTGNGLFSGEVSELDTKTEAKMSFSMDSTQYLSNNIIKLEALIDLDLNNAMYTFKENKGLINQLPLEFNGFVNLLDDGQNIDISFKNPGASFEDFLAVIPREYSKDLDDVATSGDFKVEGFIKGLISEHTIPHLDINIASQNASFKYPDLPKKVDNITINASLKNDDGVSNNTYLTINTLNFKIDDDVFKSSATLKNLTKNMLVNANIDGVLNLANISKAYPISLEKELSGILKGKLHTSFDMNALENNAFERIKNNGNINISDFIFSSEDIVNPIHISTADMIFNGGNVALDSFKAKTGTSDIDANGSIQNLLGFLLSDNKLQGTFNVNSNLFSVSDFMVEDERVSKDNKTTSDKESLKIPAFLDCTINADAKTVLYDNLTLKDVKGIVVIKDEEAVLKNMTSNIFDGELAISGLVNTKTETPTFTMDLGAHNFDISKSFKDLKLLQNLAPIAQALKGKLNSNIQLTGTLNEEFSPNLNSVTGNALAELLTTSLSSENSALIGQLDNTLQFIDFSTLDLKDLKTKLKFENGKVQVEPFELQYKDIPIAIGGSHGFDKSLTYTIIFQVPAKYLGGEINRLIGKINDDNVNEISIPVTANIAGTLTSPTVKTDLTSGISNLTKQLIEIEKQKLLQQGSDGIKDVINDVLGNDSTNQDSTSTSSGNTIKDVLNDMIGGQQQTSKDSTSSQQSNTPQTILDMLGGSKKKDSLN